MKTNKVLLIIQTILMYVMHLPLYVAVILSLIPMDKTIQDNSVTAMFITFFVLVGLITPICLINFIFSIIGLFKGQANPNKTTMVCKLALVPWYVMNFVICAVIIGGFLNPFLMLAIPILLFIFIFFTYIFMLSTSLPDISYFFYGIFRKRIQIKTSLIFSIIFLLVFCLDIVGGVMFFCNTKQVE